MARVTVEGPDPTNLPDGRATLAIDILDQGLLLVVQAMCSAYNYQTMVDNPEYDPSIPEEVDGQANPDYKPRQIQNPVGPGTFALMKTVEFWMDHGRTYAKKQGELAGGQQALEQVEPLAQVSYSQI